MLSGVMLILLTILQALAGLGFISLFKIWLKPGMMIALSLMCGVVIFSLIPFLLQLFYIPLTAFNIFLSLSIVTLLLNVRYKRSIGLIKRIDKEGTFKIQLYEIPFLIVIIAIVAISVWRCYYLPPTPRDLTSGAEVIAEYAIKEKTMLNSVFSVNLESTNNQFKPPFITSLQIIYKYAGFYFGQIWLSTIFVSFVIFLYHALCKTLHRMIAGLLLVAFLAIPEMYAYTFMALFDYSNAVFFFLGCYFLIEYFKDRDPNYVRLAGLLFGFATYIRSETLILIAIIGIALLLHHIRHWNGWKRMIIAFGWLLVPAVCWYVLSISIYINHYLPVPYDVDGLVNTNLLNLRPLLNRFMAINRELFFSYQGILYYGYFIFIFLLVLLIDLITFRKFSLPRRNWLFTVLAVYIGMAVLGYLLPLLDVDHSTKRGLFKIFPLMLLYMASSSSLTWVSEKLKAWEERR